MKLDFVARPHAPVSGAVDGASKTARPLTSWGGQGTATAGEPGKRPARPGVSQPPPKPNASHGSGLKTASGGLASIPGLASAPGKAEGAPSPRAPGDGGEGSLWPSGPGKLRLVSPAQMAVQWRRRIAWAVAGR